MEWLSSLPYRRIVSTTGSIRSPRAAPTGTEAEAEIRSTYTLPSTSSTVYPRLAAMTRGAQPCSSPG